MIINLILLLVKGILDILLLPLTVVNIGIDFVSSIPVVAEFIQIVAYVLPWSNIMPLIIFVFSLFLFRGVLALIKLIWNFIPIIR